MKKRHCISMLIVIFSFLLNISSSLAQGVWTTYQTTNTGSNGLIANWVTDIAQDTLENIWFSTGNGVSKFNGNNWRSFLPFENPGEIGPISTIAIDEFNNVWVGNSSGHRGLSKYDGSNWALYTMDDGLIYNSVTDIYVDDSILWIGTKRGISKYDGLNFTDISIGDSVERIQYNPETGQFDTIMVFEQLSINSLVIDNYNNLWAAAYRYDGQTTIGHLRMFDGTEWTNYTTADGLIDNLITCISIDDDGILWFGSEKGVSKYDHIDFTNFTSADGLISDTIYSITTDSAGTVWFGTMSGASKYDGDSWLDFTANDGLVSNKITSLLIDKDGNNWFGCLYGTSFYNGLACTNYSTNDGLINNRIRCINRSDDGIWFGTEYGATFFDGIIWTGYTSENGLTGNFIRAVEDDDNGNTWFGLSNYELSMLDYANDTVMISPYSNVYALLEDYSGNIWVGNTSGLYKYDGQNWTFIPTDELAPWGVRCLTLDNDGNIWAGLSYGVLGKYNGSTWEADTLGDGTQNNYVTSIVFDDNGYIWANAGSLFKNDGNNWSKIDSTYGFTPGYVSNITMDKLNYIWISTMEGVTRYDGTNFTNYTTDDGLAYNYVSYLDVDNYNNKWFGNFYNGLSRYCESISIEGEISYEGNVVSDGVVFLYKNLGNSALGLIGTSGISSDGHYQFTVTSSGDYTVSALGDLTIYPGTTETYYHQDGNPCNDFNLFKISCGEIKNEINIALLDSSSLLSANFTYIDNGEGNYSFTNTSTGNYNVSHWAFGNGSISNLTNPDHTFNANGSFLVVLSVKDTTNGFDCFDYFIDTLVVTGVTNPFQCTSGFVIYPDTTANTINVFNSSTGNNLNYFWDFGDGNTSTLQNLIYSYATDGPYYLCLTVDNGNGCVDMFCDSIGANGVTFNAQGGFTINIISSSPTGTDDKTSMGSGLVIYPNPTSNQLTFISDLVINEINIMSISGKVFKTITTELNRVNVTNLPSGIYVITFITEEKTIYRKFLKK